MSLCLPFLLKKNYDCLGQEEIEEKYEDVLQTLHHLEFKNKQLDSSYIWTNLGQSLLWPF